VSELTIEGYGVTQTRVRHEDIELIRQWRTSPSVSRHMFYRGEITPAQQEKWFQSIDNDENFFWVVHYEGRPIGLNSIKDIDWNTRSGEGGLFIVPEDLRQSLVVFRIAIPPLIWLFEQMNFNYVHAAVHPENKRALRYNKALGHVVDPATLGTDIIRSRITREQFAHTRAFFSRVFAGEVDCRVTGSLAR
jgi:RimJ/RimL family protein N-acetyltransferase